LIDDGSSLLFCLQSDLLDGKKVSVLKMFLPFEAKQKD
jgi:hypothetical protein